MCVRLGRVKDGLIQKKVELHLDQVATGELEGRVSSQRICDIRQFFLCRTQHHHYCAGFSSRSYKSPAPLGALQASFSVVCRGETGCSVSLMSVGSELWDASGSPRAEDGFILGPSVGQRFPAEGWVWQAALLKKCVARAS